MRSPKQNLSTVCRVAVLKLRTSVLIHGKKEVVVNRYITSYIVSGSVTKIFSVNSQCLLDSHMSSLSGELTEDFASKDATLLSSDLCFVSKRKSQ